jgi:hypothetical protein
LRGVTLDLIEECIVRVFGGADPKSHEGKQQIAVAKTAVEAARQSLDNKYRQAKKRHEWLGSEASYARELFLVPLSNPAFKRSTNILRDGPSCIISKTQFVEARDKDQQLAGKRRTMMKRAANAREALLLDERCEELVERATRA